MTTTDILSVHTIIGSVIVKTNAQRIHLKKSIDSVAT